MIHLTFRQILTRQWPQTIIAARGTATALTALAVAAYLHLECPYWAAMTALIVIQPTRGLFLEKSFYRIIGTVIGSTAGLVLLLYFPSPAILTGLLTVWIAGCVGIGNLLNGFHSYAFLLASYTCAIIAMLGYQDPAHFRELALARIVGIIIGIVVTTVVTILTTPRRSKCPVLEDLPRMAGSVITFVALQIRRGCTEELMRTQHSLLIKIAGIESSLDVAGAGSLSFRKRKRHIRNLLAILLSLVAIARNVEERVTVPHDSSQHDTAWQDRLVFRLEQIADRMHENEVTSACTRELKMIAAEAVVNLPHLGELLKELATTLEIVLSDRKAMAYASESQTKHRILPHRDWVQAMRAVARTAVAISFVAGIWYISGWKEGPLMLMGTAIMVSLFSTKDHPAASVAHAFLGASAGVTAALLCRMLLIPAGAGPLMEGFVITPFLFCGIFALTHKRTATAAFDGTLIFLLVTRPCLPPGALSPDLIPGTVAIMTGIGASWCAFRYLLPVTPAIRLRSVQLSIVRTQRILAETTCPKIMEKQLARMHHLLFRMTEMSKQFDVHHRTLIDEGLAALAACQSMQRAKHFKEGQPAQPRTSYTVSGCRT